VSVSDPYHWLEQLDSPETRTWVLAEAKLTDSYLEKISCRPALKQRLTTLLDFEKYGIPFHAGKHYFYTHNSGLQPQSVLYMLDGLHWTPKVAFSPSGLSEKGITLAGYVASPDGSKLAYGLSQGGSDWTDWHIRDLRAGKDLPDVFRWIKYYAPVFSSDGKRLYYSAFPAPPAGEELRARDVGNAVYVHTIGSLDSPDRKIYERPEHPDWQFQPHLSRHSRWLVLTAGEGEVGDKGLENVYAIDTSSSSSAVTILSDGFKAGFIYAGEDSGWLYFQTSLDAPRGRVIAIKPTAPEQRHWKEVLPQGSDALELSGSISLVGHRLIVQTLHDAHSKVSLYGLDGRLRGEVVLPGIGTASGFGGEPDSHESFYSFSGFVTPPTIFRLNVETGVSTEFAASKLPFNNRDFETHQVFYPAKDGTRIPIYLVHKKGIKLDGSNPTLLYGYGGFGNSVLPRFNAALPAWLELGGIYAVANIRGGGEYGEEWHRQGIRGHKQVVFDDFIAAAEWLIQQRYTSTPKLAIEGASNGGLLIGACITQRPDLFGAALAYVGVMDMLRFDQFGQGAGWVGDYGSPQNAEDFKALRAYSPYHNVRAGTHYPATLVITGDHDTRVMPAHSFKFAAALQAAQVGPAPVLLRVRLSTGHGTGPTTSQLIEEKADAVAFLIENLGVNVNRDVAAGVRTN
jgi:prolyl oligopeptidase